MRTEFEIKETVKRVIKCEPGYRIATEEDRKGPRPKGTRYWSKSLEGWCSVPLGSKWASDLTYAVPIKPEIITYGGKRYEVVTDPEYKPHEGDLYQNIGNDNWWPCFRDFTDTNKTNGIAKVARPIEPVSYEGEVRLWHAGLPSEDSYGVTSISICGRCMVDLPSGFKPGQRVRVEVIG